MAGSVAIAANSIPEALAQVETARLQGVDLVKLMITGGVLDAKEKGTPGELKMEPDMVRAFATRRTGWALSLLRMSSQPKAFVWRSSVA